MKKGNKKNTESKWLHCFSVSLSKLKALAIRQSNNKILFYAFRTMKQCSNRTIDKFINSKFIQNSKFKIRASRSGVLYSAMKQCSNLTIVFRVILNAVKNLISRSKVLTVVASKVIIVKIITKGLMVKLKNKVFSFLTKATPGHLSWERIFKLALKNLLYAKSRTAVTISAIAVGSGAIIFLVSFGFGLQDIVTKRLVQPNSLKLTDVSSNSTALVLSPESVKTIKAVSGVADVAPAISLAGSLSYNNSKMDVVVLGVTNSFLDYSHIAPETGSVFSKAANSPYTGKANDLIELTKLLENGVVAGESTDMPEITEGSKIVDERCNFRIRDFKYVPLRKEPRTDSEILGYVRGSILETYNGYQVWGQIYESVDTSGKAIKAKGDTWYGKWLLTEVPLFTEIAPTVYVPLQDEQGTQARMSGYLPQSNIEILTAEDMLLEKQIEEIIENGNKKKVLGETTTASESAEIAELQSLISSGEDSSATDAADLEKLLLSQQEQTQASTSAQLAIANVARKGGKEILVTTSLLNVWKLKPNAVINKAVKLEYIVSGGLIPGVAGRVLSNSEEYRIVGVIKDDTKPLIYAPIADLESMGIKKYTMAKLLATNNEELSSVRERVESLGFTTQSIVDTLLQVDRLFRIMRFLLGAFGMIALVVAIFGMFNTLTVSLLERTREVGVMKTLGTTDADIVKLFLVESLIIGFLGGVVGILVGAGGGSFINLFSALVSGNSTISLFKTPPSFMIIILLVSVAVGLLTGLYPSGRAKKISALNALRYE